MRRFAALLQKTQLAVGAVCFAVFLISMLIQVFSRLMSISIGWTEDLCLYPFIWAVLMGASAMIYENAHFRFDFLEKALKGRTKMLLVLVINLLVLGFSICTVYYGTLATIKFWNFNWATLPKVKMGYTWLVLPISGLCSSFYLLINIVDCFRAIVGGEEI